MIQFSKRRRKGCIKLEYSYSFFEASANYVRQRLGFSPEIAVILGSSLGPFAQEIEHPIVIDYCDIPHFLTSTVATHAGELRQQSADGISVAGG